MRLLKSPPSKLLQPGPVKLVLQQQRLCLLSARGASVPPTVLSAWNVTDLRRYGVVDGKFCFEAGTRSCQGGYTITAHTFFIPIDVFIKLIKKFFFSNLSK